MWLEKQLSGSHELSALLGKPKEGFFMSKRNTNEVALFTADEHAILARWFGVEPPGDANSIAVESAIRRLGFAEKPGYRTLLDVAVAFIALETVGAKVYHGSGGVISLRAA
jgi:hypothetical protein